MVGDDGIVVAAFALDDQRLRPEDPVYATFEDFEGWADTQQPDIVSGRVLNMRWHSGNQLDGVVVGRPDPLVPGQFELIHADL